MVCVRHKGRRAELRMIARLGEKADEGPREGGRSEEKSEEKRGEKQEAVGQVAELDPGRDRRPV